MTTSDVLKLARKHCLARTATMQSSAELCLADAIALFDKGDFEYARKRALKSLAYSVGVFHPDYKKAT